MKLTSATVALSLLLISAVGACAADKSGVKPKDSKKAKPTKVEKASATSVQRPGQVALTGSYIKLDVHRNGVVTDGANPVVVLDNDAIRNSGAASLRELLVLRGLSR
jgi:hypothetical protein